MPGVVAQRGTVLVTEWIEGIPLSEIIADGTQEQRDWAGQLLLSFLFSGPSRVGLLHADPHPGNFRLLPAPEADGVADEDSPERWRLGVLDFGAVNRLPGGMPPATGRAVRHALADEAEEVARILTAEGFVRPGVTVEPQEALDYLAPLLEPMRAETFTYSRAWLSYRGAHLANRGNRGNLPPQYMLIHRVNLGAFGILCQFGSTFAAREVPEPTCPGSAATTDTRLCRPFGWHPGEPRHRSAALDVRS